MREKGSWLWRRLEVLNELKTLGRSQNLKLDHDIRYQSSK
jgi:hypothetical protein